MKRFFNVPTIAIVLLVVLATCTNIPNLSAIKQELASGVSIPSVPTHLTAVAQSSSKIRLLWDSCTGADFYKVFRSITVR